MKERPILFSGEMVRAILEGRKTQTRRLVKPVGNDEGFVIVERDDKTLWPWRSDDGESMFTTIGGFTHEIPISCPYGQPGDRLWVREAWRTVAGADDIAPRNLMNVEPFTHYEADGNPSGMGKLRPSIFMPRWASRVLLEVVSVRVERLQEISEADCLAEGIIKERVIVGSNCNGGHHQEEHADRFFFDGCNDDGFEYAADAYAALWEKINGPGSWEANPYVWVIEFRRAA